MGSVLAKDPGQKTRVQTRWWLQNKDNRKINPEPDRWFWWRRPAEFSLPLRWFCVSRRCRSNRSAGSRHSAWAVAATCWTPQVLLDLQHTERINTSWREAQEAGVRLSDWPTDPVASITAASDRTSTIPARTEAGLLLLASRWPNSCWITRCECCDWGEESSVNTG